VRKLILQETGMDANELRWEKDLRKYLSRFEDCFERKDCGRLLPIYVRGQLSDLHRKSVEPIALAAGVSPRSLQQFLSEHHWDHDLAQKRIYDIITQEYQGPGAVGIIDETSFEKQGFETPGVKRQWCGHAGKVDNCTVSVHLAFTRGDFRCLLNGDLFLPEDWSEDRDRCRKAGIPDDVCYRPKWQIALELLRHSNDNGVSFQYLTFDEYYGSKPEFLRELTRRGQNFVAEVPKSFSVWQKRPRVVHRPFRKNGKGRGRKTPRLAAGSPAKCRVETILKRLKDQEWETYRLDDRTQGPSVWKVKRTTVTPEDETGLPGEPYQLLVLQHTLRTDLKYFLSNVSAETPTAELVRVALTRHWVEQCFREEKDELGMDHYEGRKYQGFIRHLLLTTISFLFLARKAQELRGEKPGLDAIPNPQCDHGATEGSLAPGASDEPFAEDSRRGSDVRARTKPRLIQKSQQGNAA
jgi:SRSO17 transposase